MEFVLFHLYLYRLLLLGMEHQWDPVRVVH